MTDISVNSLINGIAADYLTINDRAIHYGDGVFETILCHNNKLYYWQKHFQRLQFSADKLKLSCPDEQLLLNDIVQLLEKNKTSENSSFVIKIILTRGAGNRGYRFDKGLKQNRLVLLSAIDKNYSSVLCRQLLSGELCFCEQQVSINENLAGLKHLNRLENVLARNEWSAADETRFIDGLMLNAYHYVIEGTMSNLFTVKDNQLFTPDLKQSGVKGIMRDVVLDIAKNNNIKISVVNISVDDISTMDELFITNSLMGMKSVNKINDFQFKENRISNIIFNDLLKTKENYAQAI